jgi:hypothetical protein
VAESVQKFNNIKSLRNALREARAYVIIAKMTSKKYDRSGGLFIHASNARLDLGRYQQR